MMPGDPVSWQLPSRRTRFLPTLIAIGVIVVIGFVGLRGKPSDPVATIGPLPASPVIGVVVAVDSPSLGQVNAFALQTPDGSAFDFTMGQLENPTEFSPSHLSEHMATSTPIRVFYRLENGKPVAYRLEDAPAPS
ncbi:MAG: hypothetical protein ABI620_03170 [Chloroflexota bacterium]